MTKYDKMLDTACLLGLYDVRDLDDYYELARGKDALELTKWFNTNYHYLVPDFSRLDKSFTFKRPNLNLLKKLNNFKEGLPGRQAGLPYLIGPYTFLKLSKGIKNQDFKSLFFALVDVYCQLLNDLKEVHLDEPAFCLETSDEEVDLIKQAYSRFKDLNCKIHLFTYYESVDFLKDLYELPIASIGLDFVNSGENLKYIKQFGWPEDKILIAGIVNGRNIWRTNIKEALDLLAELEKFTSKIVISNASPLYHLPVTAENEELEIKLFNKISFAKERLYELKLIARANSENSQEFIDEAFGWNEQKKDDFGTNEEVRERVKNLKGKDFKKPHSYRKRQKIQKEILNLPLFPTTTIGSYPQDKQVRKKRAEYKNGKIGMLDYKKFVKERINELIKLQLDIGLDVLVHGEFERSDMVEFFAEKLDGIATTKGGWIISYGTRGYRPPIIYGDISRPNPMTLEEISYAQSLTQKPVKGMLTGPVTIISWSYVREDIPIHEVGYQIALCLQDEIRDYEEEEIRIAQIDEPAFREKAPVKKRNWSDYFNWAIKSFNLASQSKPETQIHTHMCYSEFGEIIEYIKKLDFDCITIEASRSKGDIIGEFKKINFKRQIGLGVWDIHSPAVPSAEEMENIIERALEVLPKENFWINPDCGLKTRDWPEAKNSLGNMVSAAGNLRKKWK
jgi:5-methyltetrahydropteroyltriglutamate--homocysteine methyltransferase